MAAMRRLSAAWQWSRAEVHLGNRVDRTEDRTEYRAEDRT